MWKKWEWREMSVVQILTMNSFLYLHPNKNFLVTFLTYFHKAIKLAHCSKPLGDNSELRATQLDEDQAH